MKQFLHKYFGATKWKRLFDIVVSFFSLIILSPLFLFIMAVNYFTPNCATGELENPEQYITKFGAFLRKTSMDELPQLWNILKGDMSFVGPRPLISSEIRAHRLRLEYGVYRFRPGLTGWAQINGRDDISLMKKMKLDKEYCDKWSLKLDIIILLRSFGVVVKQKGYQEGAIHRR